MVTAGPGCLWIPGLFPEKGDPPAPLPDTRESSHCRPYTGHPVLLGSQTGERVFQCRIADPSQAQWSIQFPEPVLSSLDAPAVNRYVLAMGVSDLPLSRADLPYSPHPYEARLELFLSDPDVTLAWPITVMPHVDDMWPLPEPGTEG